MKALFRFSSSLLLFLFFILVKNLWASDHFIVGVRANAEKVEELASNLNLNVLSKEAGEFANGNSFVRLLDSVRGAYVDLILPSRFDSNNLMEALITVFTLKKNGAAAVRLVPEQEHTFITMTDLNFNMIQGERLFKAAGADSVVFKSKERLLAQFPIEPVGEKSPAKVIVSVNHDELAKELSEELSTKIVTKLNEKNIAGKSVLVVASSASPVNANFVQTLSTIQKLKALGATSVELVSPYLAYARSDKVDQEGVAVIGKLIANMIEVSGADSISFVRAHAPQSEGFFNIPTKNISGRKTINQFLASLNVETIISPDAGFQKDATLYANELHLPVAIINKQRDPITSETKIYGISGADVKGKVLAIVDDETASGGTLAKAAQYLKEQGADKIYAVVTHLSGDAQKALDSDAIEKLIVTDTLPQAFHHPKIEVLEIGPEIAENIDWRGHPRPYALMKCASLLAALFSL